MEVADASTVPSTANYHLTEDSNNGGDNNRNTSLVVSTFFVYSAWELPSWLSMNPRSREPRMGRGLSLRALEPRPDNDLSTVLIAGAVYTACREGWGKFARFEWRHYLYLAGLVLAVLGFWVPNHYLLSAYVDEYLFEDVGDWAIGLGLAMVLWAMALLVHAWAVSGLESDLTRALEDINYPLLQLAGYRLYYRVEPTGPWYTLEHRIYVIRQRTAQDKKAISILEVLPGSSPTVFVGNKTLYLYTASFWGNNNGTDQTSPTGADKEYLHRCDQPAMLQSLHPILWGALHQAFWVDEIEQLRSQRRIRALDVLLIAFLAALWVIPSLAADQNNMNHNANMAAYASLVWGSWLLTIFVVGSLTAFGWAFLQVLNNHTASTIGHERWSRATALLVPILEKFNWRLEYHHPFEISHPQQQKMEEVAKLGRTPEYSISFVPLFTS